MDSIELLMQEHENIMRLVRLIRKVCCQLIEGADVNQEDFKNIIFFARNYADKHHHGKEEQILFKKMLENLGELAVKLVQHGMLVEHDQGRLYMSELEAALARYEQQPNIADKLEIIVNAGGWADHLERHIDREDSAVYTFAKRVLPEDILAEVEAESAIFEEEHNDKRIAALEIIENLEKIYS